MLSILNRYFRVYRTELTLVTLTVFLLFVLFVLVQFESDLARVNGQFTGSRYTPWLTRSWGFISGDRTPCHGDSEERVAAAKARFCHGMGLPVFSYDQRRIYDLILVESETDLPHMYVEQMAPFVDYFVLAETETTPAGTPKELPLSRSWQRFEKYHSKMIRRTINVTSDIPHDEERYEAKLRDAAYEQIVPFLKGAETPARDDILLYGKPSEVFRPKTLMALRVCDVPKRTTIDYESRSYGLQLSPQAQKEPQVTLYHGTETLLPEDLRRGETRYRFYR